MSGMEIQDIFQVRTISTPVYHPNGECFLYVEHQTDEASDQYLSKIFLYEFATKAKHCLIEEGWNISPTWNREGSGFLFLSTRNGVQQVFYYQLSDQSIKQVTDEKAGVTAATWHPDSQQFFYTTLRTTNQQVDPDVFITDSINYLENGRGLVSNQDHSLICLTSLEHSTVEELTTHSVGYGLKKSLSISPDGQYLTFENRLSTDEFNQDSGVFRLNLQTKEIERLTKEFETGMFGEPTYSKGGRYIGMIGSPVSYHTSNQLSVYAYDLKQETLQELTASLDAQVSDFAVSDCKAGPSNGLLQWSNSERCFFTLVSLEGRVSLFRVSVDGSWQELEKIGPHVTDFAIHPEKSEMLVCVSSPQEAAQVFRVDLLSEEQELLLSPNEFLRERVQVIYQKVEYPAKDHGRVPGFLVLPEDFSKEKTYPLIVNIHGGPYTMHAETFHHEVQHMVSQGYLVLLINPRGSFGYGQTHLDGVVGKYGEGDYQDLMTAVDGVLSDYPCIDPNALFVTGGSYGGFMVNWILTKTKRFKAAITQRSMSNFVSMIGTSDIGYYFFVEENGADILNPEILWEKSPLAHVKNVETPVLVMQAEQDYRCPMEQADQWYRALKYLKKEAKLIRFNHSNHELSRTGRPKLRIIRLQEMMKWFDDYR
ncbi:S9 family peptidase [Enterococcus olivae]